MRFRRSKRLQCPVLQGFYKHLEQTFSLLNTLVVLFGCWGRLYRTHSSYRGGGVQNGATTSTRKVVAPGMRSLSSQAQRSIDLLGINFGPCYYSERERLPVAVRSTP